MLNGAVARRMCESLRDAAAVIPEIGGKLQPLHAAYSKGKCSEPLAAMSRQAQKRLTEIVRFVDARVLPESEVRELDPSLTSFLNVNTPEDLRRALALARLE